MVASVLMSIGSVPHAWSDTGVRSTADGRAKRILTARAAQQLSIGRVHAGEHRHQHVGHADHAFHHCTRVRQRSTALRDASNLAAARCMPAGSAARPCVCTLVRQQPDGDATRCGSGPHFWNIPLTTAGWHMLERLPAARSACSLRTGPAEVSDPPDYAARRRRAWRRRSPP